MKTKFALSFVVVALVLALLTGCQRGASDAQVAGQVKSNIASDATVAARQIDVQAQNGVVTLSGTVQSDAERAAAATDASRVAGVKTVVNNLQVQPQAAETTPPATESAAPPPENTAPEASPAKPRHKPAHHERATTRPTETARNAAPQLQNGASQSMAAAEPAPPPQPLKVTVPDGTEIAVRLSDTLDSSTAQPGQAFQGTLAQPVSVQGQTVIPMGADVQGRVVEAKDAAHFKGSSSLTLQLTRLTVNGKSYELQTDQWARQGAARGKNTAEKVGGGAALGAIIGAIAGGGKGAAIGGAVGAGAGTGVQAATKGQQVHLDPEAVLNFRLTQPLTVTPAAHRVRE